MKKKQRKYVLVNIDDIDDGMIEDYCDEVLDEDEAFTRLAALDEERWYAAEITHKLHVVRSSVIKKV